jgi:hypothetical protein
VGHRSIDAVKLLPAWQRGSNGPSNKRMKLTKLSPAPGRRVRRLMPALARMDAGTASQLIRGVELNRFAVEF